jgi:hypothetical protein
MLQESPYTAPTESDTPVFTTDAHGTGRTLRFAQRQCAGCLLRTLCLAQAHVECYQD